MPVNRVQIKVCIYLPNELIRFFSLENPAVFDDMLNTVLGLPKKGTATLPQTVSSNRDRSIPFTQTQISTNPTTPNKPVRDVGKRLFESGTYQDPRLLYDVNTLSIFFLNAYVHSRVHAKMRKRNNLLKRLYDMG